MDKAGIGYLQKENCFTRIEDPTRARRLMDKQVTAAWPALLEGIARGLSADHDEMFQACPMDYYWSTHQSEWVTDIMFRGTKPLAHLYPKLIHHA